MIFEEYITLIKEGLKKPLPGHQFLVSDVDRPKLAAKATNAKESAVLLLFYENQGTLHLPMILRPTYNGTHSGQMGFPGGKQEETDLDLYHTALRETKEEIGIDSSKINYLGQLTQVYIPPSNFNVHVYLGYTTQTPKFIADPKEVEEIIPINWQKITDPSIIEKRTMHFKDIPFKTQGYNYDGHWIWGASALILSELITILKPVAN